MPPSNEEERGRHCGTPRGPPGGGLREKALAEGTPCVAPAHDSAGQTELAEAWGREPVPSVPWLCPRAGPPGCHHWGSWGQSARDLCVSFLTAVSESNYLKISLILEGTGKLPTAPSDGGKLAGRPRRRATRLPARQCPPPSACPGLELEGAARRGRQGRLTSPWPGARGCGARRSCSSRLRISRWNSSRSCSRSTACSCRETRTLCVARGDISPWSHALPLKGTRAGRRGQRSGAGSDADRPLPLPRGGRSCHRTRASTARRRARQGAAETQLDGAAPRWRARTQTGGRHGTITPGVGVQSAATGLRLLRRRHQRRACPPRGAAGATSSPGLKPRGRSAETGVQRTRGPRHAYVHELPLAAQVLVQALHLLPQGAQLRGLHGRRLLPRQLLLQLGLQGAHLGEQGAAVLLAPPAALHLRPARVLRFPPQRCGQRGNRRIPGQAPPPPARPAPRQPEATSWPGPGAWGSLRLPQTRHRHPRPALSIGSNSTRPGPHGRRGTGAPRRPA